MVDSTPPAAQGGGGELASALTLAGARPAGRWPFTSAGPHCRVGLEAAGHGQTQSRPPRSWSWGCPGRLVSTARKARTGPGTPVGGRRSVLCPPHAAWGRGGPALTSVDVTVRMRSRSSTSCLKVGLWEGTACQHSRMIMYLWAARSGKAPGPAPTRAQPAMGSHPSPSGTLLRELPGHGGVGGGEPPRGPVSGRVAAGRGHSQVVCAVGRLVHAVTFLQQLEELLHGDAGVR